MREEVARVVHDLMGGRIVWRGNNRLITRKDVAADLQHATVIDAQSVFDRVMISDGYGIDPYETVMSPAAVVSLVTWRNTYRNGVAVAVWAYDVQGDDTSSVQSLWKAAPLLRWDSDAADHSIDWDTVRWVLVCLEFVGGYSDTYDGWLPTTGPAYAWTVAVSGDGSPQDIRWVDLSEGAFDDHHNDASSATLIQTLNFLNCTNVALERAEPKGDRAARRRTLRALGGVRYHELVVRPAGARSSSVKGVPLGLMPLHSVRGHMARYGPEYGRGLLFGKHAGRFYVPPHVRGNPARGEVTKDYRLEASS